MRVSLVLAAAVFFGILGTARADTINTFSLNATLVNGSANGTVTLDETTGQFTASSFNVTTSGGSAVFSGTPASSTSGSSYVSNIFSTPTSAITFDLVLPVASLKNYTGGSFCTMTSTCSGRESGLELAGVDLDAVTSGTLSLAPSTAVTPEPSGLILLGVGVLLLGAFLRRSAA